MGERTWGQGWRRDPQGLGKRTPGELEERPPGAEGEDRRSDLWKKGRRPPGGLGEKPLRAGERLPTDLSGDWGEEPQSWERGLPGTEAETPPPRELGRDHQKLERVGS